MRAGVCQVSGLSGHRFGSFPLLRSPKARPRFLEVAPLLESAGGLRDTPAGWRKYAQYLEWLAEDEPRQKAMAFARMSEGWALGTREFKEALLQDEKARVAEAELGAAGRRETRELGWERDLGRCLAALRVDPGEKSRPPKWADWKVAVAAWMKTRRLASNGWLASRLGMGDPSGVSRSVTDALAGRREEASEMLKCLNSQLND